MAVPKPYAGGKPPTEMSLVINVPTEPYAYATPDEYRIEPHGTLAYDWARNDG